MKGLLALGMLAVMQFLPNIGCGSCSSPIPPGPPRDPVAYLRCSTESACPTISPTCGPAGMCTKSCASDRDCPVGPPIRSHGTPPGACIRFDGGAPFCTYYVDDSDDECESDSLFSPTRAFTSAANEFDGGSHVCLPTIMACGDGECGLFSESIDRCPADCAYQNCFPSNGSCHLGEASRCVEVYASDGGSVDAGDEAIRRTGLCIRFHEAMCLADGGCTGRGSFPAICQSGLSVAPTCFQTCSAVGKDSDCRMDQRCVPGTTPGVAICVPVGSLL